jgi:hypothetical protein
MCCPCMWAAASDGPCDSAAAAAAAGAAAVGTASPGATPCIAGPEPLPARFSIGEGILSLS